MPGVKYTPGIMIGEASGKAGCVVASRNRNGAYLRTRTIPVNPRTSSQVNARNNFGAGSINWRSLTSGQRAAWIAAAAVIILFDSLGRAYTPTGLQYYVSCVRNIFVYDSTAALPTAPPTAAVPAALLTATITATSV